MGKVVDTGDADFDVMTRVTSGCLQISGLHGVDPVGWWGPFYHRLQMRERLLLQR